MPEQRRRRAKLRARVRQQEAIADLGLQALSESEVAALYRAAVERAADGLGVEYAGLLELEADGRMLVLRAWTGSELDLGQPVTAPADGPSPAAHALREGRPVLVDGRGDLQPPAPRSVLGLHRIASSAAAVVHGDERAVGSLVAHSTRHDAFDDDDLFFLRSLANILAAAIARRRADERVRHLATIVEGSSEAIVGRTVDGFVTAWNGAAERLFGYSAEEMIGRSIAILAPPDGVTRIEEINAILARGERVPEFETMRVRKDGAQILVASSLSPILDDAGRVVGVAAVSRDLTERAELERQLHQAQRLEAVGRLAGGIAHDFNNLVTVIGGYTDVLLTEEELRPWRSDLLEIRAASERATALTRRLLAFARRQVLQPEVLDLNEVVDAISPLLVRLLGEDVDLVTSLDPDVHTVLADPGQVEQVLMNLAVNARDAMPNGGKLTIETGNVELDEEYVATHQDAQLGPHAMLAVSDTGTGMDGETLARIFEPFFTTKDASVGTGLGLSTVYGIVKQSGGNIWVYSEPGRGTTFKLYLPPVESAAPAETAPRVEAPRRSGSETVLLVEDDDSLRALALRILQDGGYTVLAASGADEAIEVATGHAGTIDLLLTDIVLPGASGRELAERLLPRCPDIRVLFMSGYSDEAIVRHGILGAEARFLEKPFSAERLARSVREALDGG